MRVAQPTAPCPSALAVAMLPFAAVAKRVLIEAWRKGNAPGFGRLNLNQAVEITLSPAETERGYPKGDSLVVYRTFGEVRMWECREIPSSTRPFG